MTTTIDKGIFDFLKKLEKNNNRDWFEANKAQFKEVETKMKTFVADLEDGMNVQDNIEGHKLFRIYRDVRFSKDKTPYKPWFSVNFKREGAALRGSYFLHVKPGHSLIGGGFYGPNPEDLLRIRSEFSADDTAIRKILKAATFKKMFPKGLQGDEVKTAPKGFSKQDPAIDLVRKKSFFVMREFSDEEVMAADFLTEANKTFKALRPYFNYMSDVLTTDANGRCLL